MKPDGLTITAGNDSHHPGKMYVHISLFKGDLSSEELDDIYKWLSDKFEVSK